VIGIVSIKIVGSLGAEAVAAVTTGHRIFFALQAVLMAVSAGTAALVARAFGARDHLEAAHITSISLWIGNLVAFVLMLPCIIFAEPIAGVFGLDEETTSQAADFIRYLSLFNVAFSINLILGASLRAAGDTKTPLWVGAAINVVNVVFVYLLVFGLYGFPEMGVVGAAVANGLSYIAGAVILLYLWYGKKLLVGVGGRGSITFRRVQQLVHIGYPAAIEQFVFQVGFVAFLWLVGFYGTEAFAAYGIGVQILSISFVVGFGFSIAGATLVGQHLGAKDPDGAVVQGWRATGLAIASMTALGLIIAVLAKDIAWYLIHDEKVVRHTVTFIYIMAIAQPLMAIEFTMGGCLRGAGDTRFPLVATMVGLIGVRVGLAVLFTYLELDVGWIYGALIGDYLIKCIMIIHRFRSGKWKQIFQDTEDRF